MGFYYFVPFASVILSASLGLLLAISTAGIILVRRRQDSKQAVAKTMKSIESLFWTRKDWPHEDQGDWGLWTLQYLCLP
jgi:hypothetical protein